jgi:amino acid transporter
VFSAILIGLLYTVSSYAGVTGWGVDKIQGYPASPAPWDELGSRYWGAIGPIILSFAIINSAFGNGNAGLNATSRVAYAMGRIGTLPAVFARLSKHQTPSFAILVHSLMSLVVAVACGLIFGVSSAFGLIGTLLTLGLLLLYFASCVSAFVYYLRERRKDFRIVQHVIVPVIPIVILGFVFASQVSPIPPFPLNLALPILVVWILLGCIYLFAYLQPRKPEALERGKEIFLKDLEPEPTNLAQSLL